MAGRLLGEVPRFEGASRVLYYGYLTPVKHHRVSVHEGRYDPVSLRLDKIKLEHAELSDIQEQKLEHVPVREGILVAKVYFSEKGRRVFPVSGARTSQVRQVELRFRPDDELLLQEGQVVKSRRRHRVSEDFSSDRAARVGLQTRPGAARHGSARS